MTLIAMHPSALILICTTAAVGFAVGCRSTGQSADSGLAILRHAPPIDGKLYRARDMVHTLNELRRLGKQKALESLSNYVKESSDQDRTDQVCIICRCLFVNPRGWEAPRLGEPR